ncbi:MAG: hypothetical protein ABI972_09030 [Acidobacteriota bacterium]
MKTIALSDGGEAYLRWCLEHYGDALAPLVLQAGIGGGSAIVVVADKVHESDLGDLRGGKGWGLEAKEAADAYFKDVIGGALQSGPNRIVVFESRVNLSRGQPSGQYFVFRPSKFATRAEDVWTPWAAGACLYLKATDFNTDRFEKFMYDVTWEGTIGYVVDLDEKEIGGIESGMEVEQSTLESIAERCSQILTPAVDGKTYLVWSRN